MREMIQPFDNEQSRVELPRDYTDVNWNYFWRSLLKGKYKEEYSVFDVHREQHIIKGLGLPQEKER